MTDEQILKEILEDVNDENIDYVNLSISTWMPSFNAEHYYGELTFWSRDDILHQMKLKREMSLEEAKRLDIKDKGGKTHQRSWAIGDKMTERFDTDIDIIESAYRLVNKVSDKINFGFKLEIDIN